MRNAFADEMTKMAGQRGDVVLLSGDIGNKLFDKFKDVAPTRFFNCGVAEANMMTVAAGMAMNGLRPVVYTITPFVTTRCLEQIRDDVCYHNVPVTIVGVGSGLGYASLGPTHHSCEDIAMLRSLPNMTVLCPGDAAEVRALLPLAVSLGKPVYMRIGKKGEPVVHTKVPALTIGKVLTVREGRDICLVSTGVLLPLALETADKLAGQGFKPSVVQMHTVKPLDAEFLARAFAQNKIVATIEEHSLIGGFGAAVAEWLADKGQQPARLCRFGTGDEFLHESGETEHARAFFGLTAEGIASKISAALGKPHAAPRAASA